MWWWQADAIAALRVDPADTDAANLLATLHSAAAAAASSAPAGSAAGSSRIGQQQQGVPAAALARRLAGLSAEQREVVHDLGGLDVCAMPMAAGRRCLGCARGGPLVPAAAAAAR